METGRFEPSQLLWVLVGSGRRTGLSLGPSLGPLPLTPLLCSQLERYHRRRTQRGGTVQGLRSGEEPANSHHRQDLQGPRHHRSVREPSTRCPAQDWALQLADFRAGGFGGTTGEPAPCPAQWSVPSLGKEMQETWWAGWLSWDLGPWLRGLWGHV